MTYVSITDEELKEVENKSIVINENITLTYKEAANWSNLIDAINAIADEYENRSLNFDTERLIDRARPRRAILKYMKERYRAAICDLIIEERSRG